MDFIIVGRCKGCGNAGAGNLVTADMEGQDLLQFLREMVASDYAISVENARSLVLRQCKCNPVGDSFTDPHAEQLTLGDFIKALGNLPNGAMVRCYSGESVSSLCSYRGYYDQLAIGRATPVRTVADVLEDARGAVGASFDGYKGGSYRMDNSTPVWFADYGEAPGYAVVGVRQVGDAVHILTRKVE